MTAPTFAYRTGTGTGTPSKYAGSDLRYLMSVLDGTNNAGDRIQIKNIERFAVPWSYYVYQEGGKTYAMRGSDGHREFEDSANPRNPIQDCMDQAYSLYGRAAIYLAPQRFVSAADGVDDPPAANVSGGVNSGHITIGTHGGRTTKNNISIIGAGMGKTFLQAFTIGKNNSESSANIMIADLTCDAGGVPLDQTREDDPTPLKKGYGASFEGNYFITNYKILRCKGQNSKRFNISASNMIRGLIQDTVIINGGLGGDSNSPSLETGADNIAAGQAFHTDINKNVQSTDQSVFRNVISIKGAAARGGGCFTGGSKGFMTYDNCYAVNLGCQTYMGFSFEQQRDYGPHAGYRFINCRGYGPRMGIQFGNNESSSAGQSNDMGKVVCQGCHVNQWIRGTRARDVVIADCTIENSLASGMTFNLCERVRISNVTITNTNVQHSTNEAYARGGIFIQDCRHVTMDHVTVTDDMNALPNDKSWLQSPYDSQNRKDSSGNYTLAPNLPQTRVLNTSYGLSATAASILPGSTIMLDNCHFLGDISASAAAPYWFIGDDATNTGMAVRIKNYDNFIMRGGRVRGNASTPSDRIRFVTTNNIDVRNVSGYNPLGIASMSVPASGASPGYTNTDGVPERVYIRGGTVSNVTKDGIQISNTTNVQVWLDPGESFDITYSAAPTMAKDRR